MLLSNIRSTIPDILIKEHWPLSTLSTLGTGGRAEFFVAPETLSQLQDVIRRAENTPVYVLGGGSNIIIPDGTIPGLTISTRKLNSIAWHGTFTAEIQAGYSLPQLVKTLRDNNLGGLEFAAGIPGTLGGAISGNAGAGGRGICEFIDELKAVDVSGNARTYRRGEFEYGYRRCSLSGEGVIIVSALMTFGEAMAWNEQEYSDFVNRRRNQPVNLRSAGCTFKNPEGYSAGKLLDECGCKGLSAGDAVVSDAHANFIVNSGSAASSDVERLIELCARKVYEGTGIKLKPEIKSWQPVFRVQ